MGRSAEVYNNGVLAGILEKSDRQQYIFATMTTILLILLEARLVCRCLKRNKNIARTFCFHFFMDSCQRAQIDKLNVGC